MTTIHNHTVQALSSYIRSTIGLYFPEKKYPELTLKLTELATESGYRSSEDFLDDILNKKNEKEHLEKLVLKLTIGETYFFRDRNLFNTLENLILPELINKKRESNKTIRIWSAACSSGEEPYSIAILLERLIPDIKDWDITILASDINPDALNKARKGVYTEWSFRSTPKWLKSEYFNKTGKNSYRIANFLKHRVEFINLNFFEDTFPSFSNGTNEMDIIFCRNVLIYFAIEDILKVSDKLYNCLASDGMLITSPSEAFHFLSSRFNNARYNDVTVYKRSDSEEKKEPIKVVPKDPINHETLIESVIIKANRLKTLSKAKIYPHKGKQHSDSNSNYQKALELYNQGKLDKATELLKMFQDANSDPKANILLAKIQANSGDLKEALSSCQMAITKNKLLPEAYLLQAMIEIEMGRFESAQNSLKQSLYLDSEMIISHFTLGNIAVDQNKQNEGNKHFRNALNLLNKLDENEIVPYSDGLTTGRLKEIVNSLLND